MKSHRRVTSSVWLTLVAASAACAERSSSAAHLGDQSLSSDALAEILVLSQPMPLTQEVASELARHWLHVSAVARHLSQGGSLLDSALVQEATWLDRRGRRADAWLRSRRAEPWAEAERVADSVYAAGHTRLLAHVFRRIGPETRPDEKELQRKAAERIRERITKGGTWAEANAESEDASTRENNGLLGLIKPGDVVPEFERAVFALRPGELSPVIETRFGFHIVHRPRLAEVRATFVRLLAEQTAGAADSAYADSLSRSLNLQFADDATQRLRAMAADPWQHLASHDSLARFDGGALTTQLFARYLVHLPADARMGLGQADEAGIIEFVEPIVVDEMLLHEAAESHFPLPDSSWRSVQRSYEQAMQQLIRDVRLEFKQDAVRPDSVSQRVRHYLEAVAARRVPLHPVPPLLAWRLLESADAGIDDEGVRAAVDRARALIQAAGDNAMGATQSRR